MALSSFPMHAVRSHVFGGIVFRSLSLTHLQLDKSIVGKPLDTEDDATYDIGSDVKTRVIDYTVLAKNYIKRTSPMLDPGSVYKSYPNAYPAPNKKDPKLRFFWEEHDCSKGFPESPEAVGTNMLHYLIQRDIFHRRQVLHVPKFCVGSILAVTRSDKNAPKGLTRFVGICIHKNQWQNGLGASFALRNVIAGEPLEIRYQLYSPLIQSIEVLRHQIWEGHEDDLRFLSDYPPRFSTFSEDMPAEPYAEEPSVYRMTERDKERVRKWFQMIYESRRRR